MRFCVRVDDLGWTPKKELDRGLALARALHEAMGGRPYLGAVIPGILEPAELRWLHSRPAGLTVAVHGWNHSRGRSGGECEFDGMDYRTCRQLLRHGVELLGRGLQHFVPPFNGLTQALAAACFDEGLDRIWGAPERGADIPAPVRGQYGWFLPSWLPLYGATMWSMAADRIPVLDTLERLALADTPAVAIVTLHLVWEAAFSPDFTGVRELSRRFGELIITPDEYLDAFNL